MPQARSTLEEPPRAGRVAEQRYWDPAVETLPRPELEALQLSALRDHLDHAYQGSRWYRRAFDAAGVAPGEIRSLADIVRLPFLDKALLRDRQLAAPLLGDLAAVDEREVVYVSASSGSTGVPTLSPFTASDFDAFQDVQAAQGLDPARDLALSRIIVAGEPGGSIPATRAAIEALWDADLYDFYGISDIFGASAGMCEEKDGLHLAEDHHLLEVLDPATGAPVADGQPGEMVLTTLQKRARPMVRFRTGDVVTRDDSPCHCGRTHARIRVHGRTDDMFIVNGVNVFPSDVEVVVRSLEDVSGEYRITLFREQHLTRFDLEVERRAGSTIRDAALADGVRAAFKNRLGLGPRGVVIHAEGILPRSVHKAKRVVDRREG